MNLTCIDAPPDVDEIAMADLEILPSTAVAPPRIATSPVSFECVSRTAVTLGEHQVVVLGEVLVAHVADRFFLDAGRLHLDTLSMGLIARMHGRGWYARQTDLFEMTRPVWDAPPEGS
ncbi:MAG: hypothetical protein WDM92_08245 [Caulobacteraceae bacterium]